MRKRFVGIGAVLLLGIATVLWVSANPQDKPSVKPAVMKSGSCCPSEGAVKATSAQAKSDVKPVALQEGKSACPYAAKAAAAANGTKNCADCPQTRSNTATVAAKDNPHGGCPFMKSTSKAMEAKAKPAPAKPAVKAVQAKKTNGAKAEKSL
ncbi:MAG: hypothetical protein HPY54_05060 [Chthonomonadetes bacterium]|nr:hypothetical protein [Chthonomonadetes bacterium]